MRLGFTIICIFGILINILGFGDPFIVLQVDDRVIPSGLVEALIVLAIIVLTIYNFCGIVNVIRGRLFVRLGSIVKLPLLKHVFTEPIFLFCPVAITYSFFKPMAFGSPKFRQFRNNFIRNHAGGTSSILLLTLNILENYYNGNILWI